MWNHLLFFFFSGGKRREKKQKKKEACPQAGRGSRAPAPPPAAIKMNSGISMLRCAMQKAAQREQLFAWGGSDLIRLPLMRELSRRD